MVNVARMKEQLVLHEGLILHAYKDDDNDPTTPSNWTIGVGYNVTGRGWDLFNRVAGRNVCPDGKIENVRVTRDECMAVLAVDIERSEKAVRTHFPQYDELNEVRQRVLVDLSFNMGTSLFTFHNTLAAIAAGDWSKAAKGLYASKWARQVGDGKGQVIDAFTIKPGPQFDRADRLAKMLLTGNDYTE